MSSTYSKNKKELAGAKVISSKDVFIKRNGRYVVRPDVDIIGKVDTSMSNFVLKVNKRGGKTDYVEDDSALQKRTKSELVGDFYAENGLRNKPKVAYLIRTDRKSKSGGR